MKHYRIIFMQYDRDFVGFKNIEDSGEAQSAFFDASPSAQLRFLMQWFQDSPESYDSTTSDPWGTNDELHTFNRQNGTLTLSLNSDLQYAGLTFTPKKITLKRLSLSRFPLRLLLQNHFADYQGHFFSSDALRFFRSRIPKDGYLAPDGSILFITSEKRCFNDYTRVYTVRRMFRHPDKTIGISSISKSDTRAEALSSLRDQWEELQ